MTTAILSRTFLGCPELLREWTSRILRARYEQSLLGWLWAVIQPVAQASMLAVIFTWVVPVNTGATPYLLFVYVATVPWAFLVGSLTDMADSLVQNMNLVNKVYFPREVLPLASMFARLADFVVAAGFTVVLLVYFRVPVPPVALIVLPMLLMVQLMLTAGLGLAAASLNVFARDVRGILVLATQLWFYASPILYPIERVPEQVRVFYGLNPMVGIIEGYRAVLLRGESPDGTFLIATAVSATILVGGFTLFKRLEYRFADIV